KGERKMVPFIALNEEPGHRGNSNRIAFRAESDEEVDRLGEIVRQAGARNVEGPEYCHEYTPGYYAVFFEDGDGNKWEICNRNSRVWRTIPAFASWGLRSPLLPRGQPENQAVECRD